MRAAQVHDPAPEYHHDAPARGSTVHTFDLQDSQVGLQIVVNSHAATSDSVPVFFNESIVSGTLEVSFRKKRKISSITIKLHGYQKLDMMQWLDQEEKAHDSIFLEFKEEVWRPRDGQSSLSPGTHSWPFSFQLPRETNRIGKNNRPYPLPPTFASHLFADHLVYEVVATVKRDGFFNEDEALIVPIRYVPRTVAAAPSPSLTASYANGTPLVGPDVDTDAWTTQEFEIRGSFTKGGDADSVVVRGELSIPKPSEFARGYPIPFIINLHSDEPSTLARFAEPSALSIYLRRQYVRAKRASVKEDKSKPVMKGTYWTVSDAGESLVLQGEFPSMLQLGPSFVFRSLSLLYSVTIEADAFNFESKRSGPLATIPCTISYFPAPGVRPRSFAPFAAVGPNGASRANAPPPAMPSLISVA